MPCSRSRPPATGITNLKGYSGSGSAEKVCSRIAIDSWAKVHPAQVSATMPGRKNTMYSTRSIAAWVRGQKKPYSTSPRTWPLVASVYAPPIMNSVPYSMIWASNTQACGRFST